MNNTIYTFKTKPNEATILKEQREHTEDICHLLTDYSFTEKERSILYNKNNWNYHTKEEKKTHDTR